MLTKRRGHTFTEWEGHQKALSDTPERLERSCHVFDTGVGDDRGKQV
eukprot:CAMPEP_0181036704 /NCGR_PEP_ID=MMETSP1070-20121207/9010_1 /TAXON_ID=265543 /ORGANISM="Minutocellus polymorphus, Strain NH13" /LENGTH=46 /DNA_ID= /DNA_START= /DNA_END= /DNA_ORIENTATION=